MNLDSLNTKRPLISIIVLTWNSASHISTCLTHLTHQTIKDFEVIVIDSASDDNAFQDILIKYPKLKFQIEYNTSNFGFSVANNIGAQIAKGKWLVFLNADAFPEPDWLEKLFESAEKNPDYTFFSSRQIQANDPEYLDGAGDAYHVSGLAWRNGYNHKTTKSKYEQKEVFSACAAAALIEHDIFLEMGGFDEDFFSYFEDVDLGFRLRLQGKKSLYVPDAVVHHVGSASTGKRSDFSVYYGYRNMIWTFFKNMPSPLIWFLLPIHISTLIFFVLYLSLRGQGKVILQAIFDAIKGMPNILQKRQIIQHNIKIKPFDILKVMSTGLFEPYTEFMHRSRAQ